MKAYILKECGSPENLLQTELPVPLPADDEVLIKVEAISINPVDVKTRAGKALYTSLKHFDPLVLGWDISGTVTAIGKKVTGFKSGDDVFGMVNFVGHGQAYAEFVAAPASQLALKPANISHPEAAAATLAALTAWQALVHHAKLKKGDKILIHAASGGVGHYAVQMAHYPGAKVTGTSSAANKNFVLELGADEHIDYHNRKFEETTTDFDIILETIGGENFIRSLEVLSRTGTIVNLIPDPETSWNDLKNPESTLKIARKRGLNALYFPVTSSGEDMQQIADLMQKGVLKSNVYKIYHFDELKVAHTEMEKGRTKGKIIVTI